jgi:hypothetical protein
MSVIVEKSGQKYVVLGAGARQGNFGSSEEPYIIASDKDGKIELLIDFADNVKVIDINGKTPKELLK